MRFKDIEIFGFGKLKNNIKIPFAKRVNVILAPNDKGKSTLLEAIFAMLYPFGDVKTDEGRKKRLRYKPWNADRYGGNITLSLDSGENYKIEKIISASPREDNVGVFKSMNGFWQQVQALKQDKYLGFLTGEHFLKVSRSVFEGLSIVRQFDVANLGESKKILDEIRSIVEMGKTGEGLLSALKKLQDKKTKIGALEKRGKRTISGSRQIRLEELKIEIENLDEQLKKSKELLFEKKKLEVVLVEKNSLLQQKIIPQEEALREELSGLIGVVQKEYDAISDMVKEMGLENLQNLRNYKNLLFELKIRFENKSESVQKIQSSLRNNTILIILSIMSVIIFSSLSVFLNVKEAKYGFAVFSLFMLLVSIYFLKIIRVDKKSILKLNKELEEFLENISKRSQELGVLESSDSIKGIEFHEDLWNSLLKELGVKDVEELELLWHKAQKNNQILNKVKDLDVQIKETNFDAAIDIDDLNRKIEIFKNSVFEKEKIQDDIKRIEGNIQVLEKTIENYFPQDDLTVLHTEELNLEEELKQINIYRQGLDLSVELLKQAGEELYFEVGPYINEFVNKYFQYLSSDYDFIRVNPDLGLHLKPLEHPECVNVEHLGKGMQTSLYLFLRFAIISIFAKGRNDSLPFILDETLNVLDDFSENRQRKFLELLIEVSSDYNIQWLYFTCQKHGQYLPIKKFLQDKGFLIREEVIGDFTILHGGENESEID
ncbi:MAG: AAA family ATPase [Candidatus Saelkia tenebricola]|nr:AAA family ATPase [Candidatus Saelkia tenebricola]